MLTTSDELVLQTLRLLLISWSKDPNVSVNTLSRLADLIEELKGKSK